MAGGVINTGSYPKGLWPGVKGWWDSAKNSTPMYWDKMFKKTTSDKAYEEYVQDIGLGIARVKPQGAPLEYDSMQQGFVARFTNVAYALGFIITKEEIDDNLYGQLAAKRTPRLRKAFHETKNIISTNIYNRAFNASYAGCDGVSLLNTAHPNFSGGTWQNKFSVDAALSQAALEDMIILMMQATDDRGIICPLHPQNLIVHPNNFFNATRILQTTKQVGTANNDINVLATSGIIRGEVVSNPFLGATGPWFLTSDIDEGLLYQEREALQLSQDNDFDTKNFKAAGYERYAFGWADPRGLYGSNAA